MSVAASIELPPWAQASGRRREHIARVKKMLEEWASALRLSEEEAAAWRDAALWHDALRDAEVPELRRLVQDARLEDTMLHGPAAASRLAQEGETRAHVLEAIRWHTVGCANWDRTGRALYMADYLEPGRSFARRDRAFLARLVPRDFDGVFRQVVRQRLEWALREGHALFDETVALWNSVR